MPQRPMLAPQPIWTKQQPFTVEHHDDADDRRHGRDLTAAVDRFIARDKGPDDYHEQVRPSGKARMPEPTEPDDDLSASSSR